MSTIVKLAKLSRRLAIICQGSIEENGFELKSRFSEHKKVDSKHIQEEDGNVVELAVKAVTETESASDTSSFDKQKDPSSSTIGKEVAIQANEYEIERGSSHLPHRRRFVPLRFSDFRVFASNVKEEEEEEEEEDSSFNPRTSAAKSSPAKPAKVKRGRGRPRKYPDNDTPQEAPTADTEESRNSSKKEIVKAPNGFKCNICERVFSLRGNAKAHLITHSDERPFTCDFSGCDKKLRSKESLRRHKLSHMGIKMFECSECKKKFSCNLSLQEHMTLHTGQKPLTCEVCGRKFRQVAVLKRHLTTHSNSKPYACGLCGRRFALKVYVHSHMKTHTGERPFSCDVCNKSFAHASDLNRHKIIHTGKKPYQCSMCGMRYADPSSKRRHEREHQNKQQYMCHICNQKFPRAGQLRVHIVKEHSSEKAALPYRVEIGMKSDPKPWADCDITNKPDLVVAAQVVNQSTVSNQSANTQPATASQEESSFISPVQPQALQLVLENSNSNQVGCIVSGGIVIQEDAPDIDKSCGQTMIMELPRDAGEEFMGLQPQNCTYHIVNSDDKNQVFELRLEGPQLPEGTNAVKINLSELQMKDSTVALIQDGDSLTVINQPDIENEGAMKITEDSMVVGSDDVILTELVGRNSEAESSKDIPCHNENSTISIVQSEVDTDTSTAPKSSEQDQSADILLEHGEESLSLNSVESLSVSEIKPESDVIQDVSEGSGIPLSTIFPIMNSTFISNPDLNSQEYYNWLAAFSEACKRLSLPLEKDVFLKISQVQKTLSDYMATPSGVISDKNNFKILMNITQDLSTITSSHLSYMYSNLSQ